jgi:hypothetical protein
MTQWDERYFLSFYSEAEGMGEAILIQTRMHPSQQNKNYKFESCRLMYAKITNEIPIDWCQYVCLLTYPPYHEVGTTWIDWCPLFFVIPTLITAAGRQISILKFCNFCSKTKNHSRMEKLLCSGQHTSKPAEVLRFSRYSRIANSFVLSVSHLHSQSVWAPSVYLLLDSSCCQYCYQCYVTLYLVGPGVPNWLVNSCRLCLQLQKWRPCIQHQGRRLSRQAARCICLHENAHVALANVRKRLTTSTSRASSRRAPNHSHWFWTSCTWLGTCRVLLQQRSLQRVFGGGYSHLVIMYDIILDFSDIAHESLWYVPWYHSAMISYNLDIIDAGPWYRMWYIHDINMNIKDIGYDIIDAGPWYHIWYCTWYHIWISKI